MFSKSSDNKNVRKKPTRRKVSDKKKTFVREQASASYSPTPDQGFDDQSEADYGYDQAEYAQSGAGQAGDALFDYQQDSQAGYTDQGSADAYADGDYADVAGDANFAGDEYTDDGYATDSQASDGAAPDDQGGEEPWIPEDMGLFDENGDFAKQESEYAIPPRHRAPRGAASEDDENKKPRKPLNKKLVALVSVVAILVLVIGGFNFLRWHLHDDAQLIQGEWKIAAADRTVVITAHKIKVTKQVSYDYELNTDDKILLYSFANMADSAPNNYYFSLDGTTLVITEGEPPNILVQLGLLPNPAIAADTNNDRVIVLQKVSNDTKAKPGKYKGSLSTTNTDEAGKASGESATASTSADSSKDGADKSSDADKKSSSSESTSSKSSDSSKSSSNG